MLHFLHHKTGQPANNRFFFMFSLRELKIKRSNVTKS